MTMPINLVLIRHAESEGNVAKEQSRRGDSRAFTPAFRKRPGWQWRLTEKGCRQAAEAREWVQKNLSHLLPFDRHYVSPYIRTMETAALLQLPRAQWTEHYNLRERDWGDLDVLPDEERRARFGAALSRKKAEGFFWRPPNGESLAEMVLRLARVADTLHREHSGSNVLMACHGEVILGWKMFIERLTNQQFLRFYRSDRPFDQTHNCQIVHYTRRDPVTGELSDHLDWVRSVCPWDLSLSRNKWVHIERKRYTNRELLEIVEKVPRLVF